MFNFDKAFKKVWTYNTVHCKNVMMNAWVILKHSCKFNFHVKVLPHHIITSKVTKTCVQCAVAAYLQNQCTRSCIFIHRSHVILVTLLILIYILLCVLHCFCGFPLPSPVKFSMVLIMSTYWCSDKLLEHRSIVVFVNQVYRYLCTWRQAPWPHLCCYNLLIMWQ